MAVIGGQIGGKAFPGSKLRLNFLGFLYAFFTNQSVP